MMVYR